MIIFDLDGCLADCEHRRHFVDPSKRQDCYYRELSNLKQMQGWYYLDDVSYPKSRMKFKPDWKAFYEACDKDLPIREVISIFKQLTYAGFGNEFHIWSARCQSVFKKTDDWIHENDLFYNELKMRPIGDNTPDAELKEKWLDEYLSLPTMDFGENGIMPKIDFVFDSDPKSIEMWRRRGIFVFDVNQSVRSFR